jgi:glycosyltransferase involved in cell wall biosynthesis
MRSIPKVSIIIASYNSARFLPETISSILCQTFQEFEIIVVNDGSTDNTVQILESYLPYIQLVNQENKGPGAARNAVLHRAQGDYLVFLDADDLLLPDKLKVQVEYLDKFPQIGVVYSSGYYSTLLPDGTTTMHLFTDAGYLRKDLGHPEESIKILAIQNAFPIHAAMVRRDSVLKINGFDERIPALADWDLWYRIAQTNRFEYVDVPLVEYRNVPTSLSKNNKRKKIAYNYMYQKILTSDGFFDLPARNKSDFYFRWGIIDLQFSELAAAKIKFKKSLAYNPSNFYAILAIGSSMLFGLNSVFFLNWKRKHLAYK